MKNLLWLLSVAIAEPKDGAEIGGKEYLDTKWGIYDWSLILIGLLKHIYHLFCNSYDKQTCLQFLYFVCLLYSIYVVKRILGEFRTILARDFNQESMVIFQTDSQILDVVLVVLSHLEPWDMTVYFYLYRRVNS